MDTDISKLAQQIADLFAALPQVQAVAISGSRGANSKFADSTSDIDLYVYTLQDIPIHNRQFIIEQTGGATQANLNLNYWGPGDEWFNKPIGIEVDIVYFNANWMDEQIDLVFSKFQASQGYTTCFAHTIAQSIILFDPQEWLSTLQKKCRTSYPEFLRQNIISLNYPLLRGIIPAYSHQLEKAIKRHDRISINHRLTALFASYFDIIFAINRQLHPGEKRIIDLVIQNCSRIPENMKKDIDAIFYNSAADISALATCISTLLNHLDQLMIDEGLISQ